MIKNILKRENDNKFNLSNIKNALNETIPVEQKIKGELSFEPDKGKIIEKIITDNRKRKDFSILNKYLHDRRLPELFEYIEDNKIPHEKIKIELDSYNRAKETIFDTTFILEKTLINIDKNEIIKYQTNNIENLQFESFLKYLKNKNIIEQEEFYFLKIVRNTFSHNQFPQKAIIEKFVQLENNKPFAKQISEIYDAKIEQILTKVKQI